MSDALRQLPPLIASHVLLAAAAMALALLIGLPLGLASARRPRLATIAVGFAGLVQTIPGLALLALFYPLLLALSVLIGGGIPALGFLPALLALTLYALLPILRNLIAGLKGIDPAVLQAADAVGMTPAQRLRLVEAPLAAPVAMAGIRTAAVWTIGAATLATTVGYPSWATQFSRAFRSNAGIWCFPAASPPPCSRSSPTACSADRARDRPAPPAPDLCRPRPAGPRAFAHLPAFARRAPAHRHDRREEFLRTIYPRPADRRPAGESRLSCRLSEGLGSAVAFRALQSGDIDVYVEYSGTLWLWTGTMGRTDTPSRQAMLDGIAAWMAAGPKTALIGPLGFENAYALAVRPDSGLSSIADLAAKAPNLTLGADLEFLDRPEWRAIRDAYGLKFRATRAYSPTFMYRALQSGQADVISAFSSDGRIAADHLAVLADPKGAVPHYDAILLAAPARAHDQRFLSALRPLVNGITVEDMRTANYSVDRDTDKQSPEAAATWLGNHL